MRWQWVWGLVGDDSGGEDVDKIRRGGLGGSAKKRSKPKLKLTGRSIARCLEGRVSNNSRHVGYGMKSDSSVECYLPASDMVERVQKMEEKMEASSVMCGLQRTRRGRRVGSMR